MCARTPLRHGYSGGWSRCVAPRRRGEGAEAALAPGLAGCAAAKLQEGLDVQVAGARHGEGRGARQGAARGRAAVPRGRRLMGVSPPAAARKPPPELADPNWSARSNAAEQHPAALAPLLSAHLPPPAADHHAAARGGLAGQQPGEPALALDAFAAAAPPAAPVAPAVDVASLLASGFQLPADCAVLGVTVGDWLAGAESATLDALERVGALGAPARPPPAPGELRALLAAVEASPALRLAGAAAARLRANGMAELALAADAVFASALEELLPRRNRAPRWAPAPQVPRGGAAAGTASVPLFALASRFAPPDITVGGISAAEYLMGRASNAAHVWLEAQGAYGEAPSGDDLGADDARLPWPPELIYEVLAARKAARLTEISSPPAVQEPSPSAPAAPVARLRRRRATAAVAGRRAAAPAALAWRGPAAARRAAARQLKAAEPAPPSPEDAVPAPPLAPPPAPPQPPAPPPPPSPPRREPRSAVAADAPARAGLRSHVAALSSVRPQRGGGRVLALAAAVAAVVALVAFVVFPGVAAAEPALRASHAGAGHAEAGAQVGLGPPVWHLPSPSLEENLARWRAPPWSPPPEPRG